MNRAAAAVLQCTAFHVSLFPLFLALQKVVYQCTYPGCRIAAVKSIRAIESHVRKEHLGRAENHPDDGEEEFYYTEVEIPNVLPRTRAYTEPASQMANLSLADHLDMARPAHEDPEITRAVSGFRSKMRSLSGTQSMTTPSSMAASSGNKNGSLLINQFQGSPASLTTPITIAPSVVRQHRHSHSQKSHFRMKENITFAKGDLSGIRIEHKSNKFQFFRALRENTS